MKIKNSDFEGGFVCFNNCQFGDKDVKNLCTLHTHIIRQLYLCGNKISSAGMAKISKAKWDGLKQLYLDSSKIGNKGCKYLSKTPFYNLRQLAISDNMIGTAGIIHLSKLQSRNLKTLFLESNPISIGGTQFLVRTKWNKLATVYLSKSELTFDDLSYLLLFNTKGIRFDLIYNLVSSKEEKKIQKFWKEKSIKCQIDIQQL